MTSGSGVKDTWVRPVGRIDVAPILAATSSHTFSGAEVKGKRPGDLFRTADDAPLGSVSLGEDKNERKGFGRW